jgi:hypothetical protein
MKIMGFFLKLVWIMEYYRFMGFGYEIPANQVGGSKMLWVFAGYGLSQVWVRTGSTVPVSITGNHIVAALVRQSPTPVKVVGRSCRAVLKEEDNKGFRY